MCRTIRAESIFVRQVLFRRQEDAEHRSGFREEKGGELQRELLGNLHPADELRGERKRTEPPLTLKFGDLIVAL